MIKSSLEISQIMTINQKPIFNSKPKTIPFVKTLISALLHRYDQLLTRHPLHCNYHKETALVNNIMEKEYFRQNSNVTLFSDFDMSTSYLK